MRTLFMSSRMGGIISAMYRSLGEGANPAKPLRLLDRMWQVLRAKHYAYSTEQAYVHWARRYILFHSKRHPQEMGGPEIERFLTHHMATNQSSEALCGPGLRGQVGTPADCRIERILDFGFRIADCGIEADS